MSEPALQLDPLAYDDHDPPDGYSLSLEFYRDDRWQRFGWYKLGAKDDAEFKRSVGFLSRYPRRVTNRKGVELDSWPAVPEPPPEVAPFIDFGEDL